MNTTLITRLTTIALVVMAVIVPLCTVASAAQPQVRIIERAACIGDQASKSTNCTSDDKAAAADIKKDASSLNKFTKAANALLNPALLALAGVAPLGCLVGAASLMFGNRRGMVFIGSSLGTLVFVACLRGIVA
jgi:hypothetical protein